MTPHQPSKNKQFARRKPNSTYRSREHLLPKEVDRLLEAARKRGRHGNRDATMILLAYRHGMRPLELTTLRWDQVDLNGGALHVNRAKNGSPSTHPVRGTELRALRQLRRDYPDGPYLFISERGGPMTVAALQRIVRSAGEEAKFSFKVHPHMLRHACGFYLANKGFDTRAIQAYLGHRNIQHTVRYTELAPHRFNNFWSD
jgi:integrase